MTLVEFKKLLNNEYKNVEAFELCALRKLILNLDKLAGSSFEKLTVSEIEIKYPYFLLSQRHPSVSSFLLYKKLVERLNDPTNNRP